MRQVTTGDRVQILCASRLRDGTRLETEFERNEPYWIRAGGAGLAGRAAESVLGMKVGDKKTVTVPAARLVTIDIEVLAIKSSAVEP